MADKVDAIVIEEIELKCLAALLGFDTIYGLYRGKDDSTRYDRRVKYAIYSLAKKGYISMSSKGDEISIDVDIVYMCQMISGARKILDIQVQDTAERVVIYRGGDASDGRAVIMRSSISREDEVLISLIEDSYVLEYMIDEGYKLEYYCDSADDVYGSCDIEDRVLIINKLDRDTLSSDVIEVYETCLKVVSSMKEMKLTRGSLVKSLLN